jgi:hypothetical protein
MNPGIDVGHSAVMVVGSPDRMVTFPRVMGTPD